MFNQFGNLFGRKNKAVASSAILLQYNKASFSQIGRLIIWVVKNTIYNPHSNG